MFRNMCAIVALVVAAAGPMAPRAKAALVTYQFAGNISQSDFEQIAAGSNFGGTLSFDPSQAAPTATPGVFSMPLQLSVDVGPYTITASHTNPVGLVAKGNQAAMPEMFAHGGEPTYANLKTGINFGGPGLFDDTSGGSLAGAKWENVALGNGSNFGFFLFNDLPGLQRNASGVFTSFSFLGGGPPPVPEPRTFALFCSALGGILIPRLRNRRKAR